MSVVDRISGPLRVARPLFKGLPPSPSLIPGPVLDAAAHLSSARGRISKLTGFERLLVSLRHREPDRVPCSPVVCGAGRRLSGISYAEFSTNPRAAAETYYAAFEQIGGEVVVPLLDLSVEAADFGQKMVFCNNSTAHPDYSEPLIRDVEGYRRLRTVDLGEAVRMQGVLEMLRVLLPKVGLKGLLGGFAFGPLGVLGMMRGAERMLKDCVLHPKEVMAALETITGVLVEYVEAQCDTGVVVVVLDTLYASWNGLSKELWEKIEGPFARQLAEAIRRRDCLVGIHNCGDGIYFDAQIRAMEPAVISFAHLPDDCSDRRELKRRYGGQVVLMGLVDTPLLCHGTPYQVMEECRRQIEDLAPGGGYILAPGCEYPPNAPLENAYAIVKAAERYGRA